MRDEIFERSDRRVLLLQGPPSVFWKELADAIVAKGACVSKINFSLSDQAYWGRPAHRYAGPSSEFGHFLLQVIAEEAITDVLMYSDGLPHHKTAIALCRRLGLRAFVIENGYLRPDWVTFERDGMGPNSDFPRTPEEIRRLAVDAPPPNLDVEHRHAFVVEAANEVCFHLLNGLTPPAVWRYDTDRYYHAAYDYAAWIRRLAMGPFASRSARRVCDRLFHRETAYFLAPLQLQSDYQIRDHTDYGHQREHIERVTRSFAKHAPRNAHLVFKVHPLDNGAEPWARLARAAARRERVRKRVWVIDGGPFGTLVNAARGVVVANSTSGLHAIRALKPTIALGRAIYDVPGMTHQRGLDTFWRDPDPIDPTLVTAFIRALAHRTQVKGSFYARAGRRVAVAQIVTKLEAQDAVTPGAAFHHSHWRRSPRNLSVREVAQDKPGCALPAEPNVFRSVK